MSVDAFSPKFWKASTFETAGGAKQIRLERRVSFPVISKSSAESADAVKLVTDRTTVERYSDEVITAMIPDQFH